MKRSLFFIFLAALLIFQLWVAHFVAKYPFFGIRVEQNGQFEYVVKKFDPSSEHLPAEVKIGDIIKKIDGRDPGTHHTIKVNAVEQFHTLLIERNGMEIEIDAQNLPKFGKVDIMSVSGSALSLFIALLIFLKIRTSPSALLLSFSFLNIASIFMTLSATAREVMFAIYMIRTSLIMLPIVFLHFMIVFFKEKGIGKMPFIPIKLLYIPPICYGGLATPLFYILNKINDAPTILFFACGIFFNFVVLTQVLFRYRSERSQEATLIRTIWFSLGISFFPITFLSLIPSFIMHNTIGLVNPNYTGWFVMFFPASFAYLIASKQIYDIHFVLRRLMVASAVSVLPAALFVGLVKAIVLQVTMGRLFILFILFVAAFTIVLYALEYFTTKLEPVMFPRKHHLQKALRTIARNLTSISSFRELKSIILIDIVCTLQVFGGAIVFRYPDNLEVIGEGAIDEAEVERLIGSGMTDHSHYSVFPVNRHEEYETYLVMTRKKTNTLLGQEEAQWLHLIITYLAVSLENVHLIRKLTMKLQHFAAQLPDETISEFNWFRKLLFRLQEKERERIATDLHDTAIQDLYFLKRRLLDFTAPYPPDSGERRKADEMIDYIEIIASNLRTSCFELNPHLLNELGLVETVRKLVDQEKMISPFSIDFFTAGTDRIERLGLDAKRHIFRVTQELINNAKKHSLAKGLFLEFSIQNEMFQLLYEDDGVGFTPEQILSKEIGGHGLGIEQMKSRILSLNGQFKLESAAGQGVKLRVAFSIKEELSA